MIGWFADAFGSELTQRALLGGLLAAVTTSVIGTWVVVRGHVVHGRRPRPRRAPGIALAFPWGVDLTLGALVERGRDGGRHRRRAPAGPPARGHRHRPAVRRDARPRRRDHQPGGQLRRRPHRVPVRRHPRHRRPASSSCRRSSRRRPSSPSRSSTARSSPCRSTATRRPPSASDPASPTPPCSCCSPWPWCRRSRWPARCSCSASSSPRRPPPRCSCGGCRR